LRGAWGTFADLKLNDIPETSQSACVAGSAGNPQQRPGIGRSCLNPRALRGVRGTGEHNASYPTVSQSACVAGSAGNQRLQGLAPEGQVSIRVRCGESGEHGAARANRLPTSQSACVAGSAGNRSERSALAGQCLNPRALRGVRGTEDDLGEQRLRVSIRVRCGERGELMVALIMGFGGVSIRVRCGEREEPNAPAGG